MHQQLTAKSRLFLKTALRGARSLVPAALGLILALGCGSALSADSPPVLRAGAAAVDVTPREFPVNMPGGFSENLAQGAHDPLHARTLVLDDGKTMLAMVVVDNLGVAREVCDEAKRLAADRCGIAPEKILVASTHTHSRRRRRWRLPQVARRGHCRIDRQGPRRRAPPRSARPHPLPEEVFNRRWYLKPGKMAPNPSARWTR